MEHKTLLSAVDFRYVLLDSYKKMNIKEDELVVILMLDHLLEQGNTLVTNDMVSFKMNYSPSVVDKIMVGLLNKGFVSYDTKDGKMRTSLEPLKNQVYLEFQKGLAKERSTIISEEKENHMASLTSLFEEKLGRSLSPLESSSIHDWIEAGFKDDEIKNALLDALSEGKKNLRAVDKKLREKRSDDDIRKEGYTATSPTWDKDIEETMKMAKEMWGSDDGKK